MPFPNTLGQLRTQIAIWIDREDLTDTITECIHLAEVEIFNKLRSDENEFVLAYRQTDWQMQGFSPIAYTFPDDEGIFKRLPENFLEMSLVTWNGEPLQVKSKESLTIDIAQGRTPFPRYFAYSGREMLFSGAISDDPTEWEESDVLEFTYYGSESLNCLPPWQVPNNPVENPPVEDTDPVTVIQSSSNTNRILQTQPNLYYWGTMYMLGLFLQDDAMAQKWGALFKPELEALDDIGQARKYSGSTNTVSAVYDDTRSTYGYQ